MKKFNKTFRNTMIFVLIFFASGIFIVGENKHACSLSNSSHQHHDSKEEKSSEQKECNSCKLVYNWLMFLSILALNLSKIIENLNFSAFKKIKKLKSLFEDNKTLVSLKIRLDI